MEPETKAQVLLLPAMNSAPSGKLCHLSDLNLLTSKMGPTELPLHDNLR